MTPIPSGIEPPLAAPLMCGGVTVYTALKRAGIRPGDWAAISGAGGGLGHLGIQYAKAMGGKALALDSGRKRDFCRGQGADAFIDFTQFTSDEALAGEVKKVTGGGARIVLMCVSSGKAYGQAMAWLRFRGTLMCLGIPDKKGCLVPDVQAMVTNETRIMGTCVIP